MNKLRYSGKTVNKFLNKTITDLFCGEATSNYFKIIVLKPS